MIQLNPDCVLLELENGNALPCSVEVMTIELLGENASWIDPEILRNICQAVVLYLRDEMGKESISFHEFTHVLEEVMRGFGFDMVIPAKPHVSGRVDKTDIGEWLERQELGFELILFQRLREELSRRLEHEQPSVLWIHGFRTFVKSHLGARRWSPKCQVLNDQLITFMRECFDRQANTGSALVLHS